MILVLVRCLVSQARAPQAQGRKNREVLVDSAGKCGDFGAGACLVWPRHGRPRRRDEKIEKYWRSWPGNCGDFDAGAVLDLAQARAPQAQGRKNQEVLLDLAGKLR